MQRHRSLYISPEHRDQHSTNDVDAVAENNRLLPVLDRLLKLLADKRAKGGRPEEIGVSLIIPNSASFPLSFSLQKMSYQQLKEEKYAVQKGLLSFERKYGRPVRNFIIK